MRAEVRSRIKRKGCGERPKPRISWSAKVIKLKGFALSNFVHASTFLSIEMFDFTVIYEANQRVREQQRNQHKFSMKS